MTPESNKRLLLFIYGAYVEGCIQSQKKSVDNDTKLSEETGT